MKSVNDNDMLQYINRAGVMGEKNLERVLKYPIGNSLRRHPSEQKEIYHEMSECSKAMLHRRGKRAGSISRAAYIASAINLRAEMLHDKSEAAVADMVTHGNTLGLKKCTKYLNHYDGNNENVRRLALRLMHAERSGIEVLKSYL